MAMQVLAEGRMPGHAAFVHLGYISAAPFARDPMVTDAAPLPEEEMTSDSWPDAEPAPEAAMFPDSRPTATPPGQTGSAGTLLIAFFVTMILVLVGSGIRDLRRSRPTFRRRLRPRSLASRRIPSAVLRPAGPVRSGAGGRP